MSALDLPPVTASVPTARRFVRTVLADSRTDVETATLLVSELVTNAILHARTTLTVNVTDRSDGVRVEVRDGSPVRPRIHTFSPTSATGRGLRLLDRLARRWGVEPDPAGGGKVVWFEVGEPAEDGWADPSEYGLAEDWVTEGARNGA